MPEDVRKSFHRDLDVVRRELAQLAALTTEVVTRATDTLLDADLLMARAIIDHDDEIDALSAVIEQRCFRLLALQSPMARDLRVLAASMRINDDLERAADLGVNIAKATRRLYGHAIPPRLRGIITDMNRCAVGMLRTAMDAYAEGDGALGASLDAVDDELDQLQRDFVEAMFICHEADAMALTAAVQLALIARFYERIGDHAVTIGERVAFMVSRADLGESGQRVLSSSADARRS